jgi:hypothetical protein
MPLLDHFHPPVSDQRSWEAIHNWWAAEMASALNAKLLPERYFADFQLHVGSSIEVDVGTFDNERAGGQPTHGNGHGGVTVAVETWAPPKARTALPIVFPDEIEVRVFRESGGARLVAAVEIVSPGNKDRPEACQAFATKCIAYVQRGIGLVIVDVVTERHTNLHDELVRLLGAGEAFRFPFDSVLYATAYHPLRRDESDQIDWWAEALTVGQTMPTMPLPVRGLGILPLDLEATYTAARQRMRLG